MTRTLPKVAEACKHAFATGNWKIVDADPGERHFFVREPWSPLALVLHYQTKMAVFLQPDGPGRTKIDIHGKIFGMGPLARGRIRKMVGVLRAQIEAAAG